MKNVVKENYLSALFNYRGSSLGIKPKATGTDLTYILRELTKKKLFNHLKDWQ